MLHSSLVRSKMLSCLAFIAFAVILPAESYSQTDRAKQVEDEVKKDQRVSKVIVDKKRLTPSLVQLKTPQAGAEADAMLQTILKLRPGIDNLLPFRSIENKGNVVVEKKQQFFKGIKVEHGKYTLLKASGLATAFMGEYYQLDATLSTTPSLTEAQALNAAKQFVGAREYAWEQIDRLRAVETNPNKKAILDAYYNEMRPKGELVIVEDFIGRTKKLGLAYKFDIYAADPLSRGHVYVNAHTGQPMFYNRIIKHLSPDYNKKVQAPSITPEAASVIAMDDKQAARIGSQFRFFGVNGTSVQTTVPTRYAGNRVIGTKKIAGIDPNSGNLLLASNPLEVYIPGDSTYVLIDDNKGGGLETYDMNGVGGVPINVAAAYPQSKSFTDVNNNWTLAEHKRSNAAPCNEGENDDPAFDAHWGAGIVYDYWKKIHGRSSFDNANGVIKSYIHSGAAYDNAFWNGSVMTYGDGSFQCGANFGFMPLTSLDVCGHEIGHAICTYTSDLAYQNESGGMNEGFSDIWAACIEQYALDSVDATLISGTGAGKTVNGFKVWSIGEQIDANDATGSTVLTDKPSSDATSTALRYMDDPTKAGNPKYYYGTNWTEAIDCTPTLVNDQCGVHNNSGVLNRWFYLLTVGGSGNVQTDNTKNTTGAVNGQAYNVTGLGFKKAEKIAYLTEQLLSPNATYWEARNTSMQAAELLFGKGSFEQKQVIVAWHGVAVGGSSDTALYALMPPFSAIVMDSVNELTAKTMTCSENNKKLTLSMTLMPPGRANAVNVTITPSGTATPGRDYILPNTTFTYGVNQTGLRTDSITIINDGDVESTETIILQIHAQEAFPGTFVKDTTITITISDDDVVPQISNTRVTLLNENFDATATGSLPSGWTSIDKGGNNVMSWKVGDGGGGSAFTTKSAMADENAIPGVAPTYDPTVSNTIILRTPLIDATGKANVALRFSWAADGEQDGPPVHPLDYGKVLYSFDGTNFQPFQFTNKEYALSPIATRDSINLTPEFNNRKFYIGFQWFNDDLFAVGRSFHIDSVRITAGARQVETEVNDGVGENVYAGSDVFFLSGQDGEVIARVNNPTSALGCTAAQLTSAGNGTATSTITYNGTVYDRTKKVIKITPTTNGATATYNLSLFYTNAELTGFTGNLAALRIMKVKDGVTFSGTIAPADAELITPTITDNSASGHYVVSANGLIGFSQFAVVKVTGSLPVKLISFSAVPVNNQYIKLHWAVAQENGIQNYVLERAEAGSNNFQPIATINAVNSSTNYSYEFADKNTKLNVLYQYRIRIVENNRSTYSEIKTAKLIGKGLYVNVSPNPSNGIFNVDVEGVKGKAEVRVINAYGQEVYRTVTIVDNSRRLTINLSNQAKGMYTVQVQTEESTMVKKAIIE